MTGSIIHNGEEYFDEEAEAMAAYRRGRALFHGNVVSLMPYILRRGAEIEARGKQVRLDVGLERLSEDNVTDLAVYLKTLELAGGGTRQIKMMHELWLLETDPSYVPPEDEDEGEEIEWAEGGATSGQSPKALHECITDGGEAGEICTDASGEDGQPPQLEPGERPGAMLDAIREEIEKRQRQEENAALDAIALKQEMVTGRPARDFGWWTADSKDIDLDDCGYLIPDVLPAEGITLFFGKEKNGKTLIVMDIGLHLALGLAWRGNETEAIGVSYFNPEGGKGARLRVAAWCREHNVRRVDNFRLSTMPVDLFSSTCDSDAVIADIRKSQPNCKFAIFDTLNRIIPGANENAVEDMGKAIRNLDKIGAALGIAVGLVHHEPKTGEGPRGSGSLSAAVNASIRIVREQGELGLMKVELLRDGEPGNKFPFDVKGVLLGKDRRGRPVTAAVAVAAEQTDKTKVSEVPGRKLSDYQVIVLEALTQLVNERGRPNPGGDGFPDPGRVRVVSVEQLVPFAAEKIVSAARKERPRIVERAITALQGRGLVKVQDDLIWNPKQMSG